MPSPDLVVRYEARHVPMGAGHHLSQTAPAYHVSVPLVEAGKTPYAPPVGSRLGPAAAALPRWLRFRRG
jgi:hypothetical protein